LDGFYLFTDIKPGRYNLKVDDQYAFRKAVKVQQKLVEFSNQGDVISELDLVLQPMDKANGYIAEAGHFENPAMLKLYYLFLNKKIAPLLPQKPFYIRERVRGGGYTLSLGYYEAEDPNNEQAQNNAQYICQSMQARRVPYKVKYRKFDY
jgi:hypothetical protein